MNNIHELFGEAADAVDFSCDQQRSNWVQQKANTFVVSLRGRTSPSEMIEELQKTSESLLQVAEATTEHYGQALKELGEALRAEYVHQTKHHTYVC